MTNPRTPRPPRTSRNPLPLAALAACLGLAALTGCEMQSRVSQGIIVDGNPAAAGVPGIGIASIAGAAAITAPYKTDGPRLFFENASTRPLEVRWWIGRIDVREPTGVADLRTAPHLAFVVNPGDTVMRRCERQPWPTGTVDAVVRAEIRDPNDPSAQPTWLELPQPGPFKLRAKDHESALTFDRPKPKNAEVVTIPAEEAPIGHNGPFPVYASERPGG